MNDFQTDCLIKASPSKPRLVGGSSPARSPQRNRDPATRSGGKAQIMFLLVNSQGDPLLKNDSFISYFAHRPCLAAIKAFNALARKDESRDNNILKKPDELLLRSWLFHKRVDHQTLEEYIQKSKSINPKEHILYLRKPDENKVHGYRVKFTRILFPNNHEIKNKIVTVSKSEKLFSEIPKHFW